MNTLYLILKRIQNTEPQYPSIMSNELQSLIKGLLKKTPQERLGFTGAEEIKSHEFFKGFN